MKRQHFLDDLFKDRLQNHVVDAPQGVWEKIADHRASAQQPIGKKDKRVFLLILLLLTLAGGGALISGVFNQKEINDQANRPTASVANVTQEALNHGVQKDLHVSGNTLTDEVTSAKTHDSSEEGLVSSALNAKSHNATNVPASIVSTLHTAYSVDANTASAHFIAGSVTPTSQTTKEKAALAAPVVLDISSSSWNSLADISAASSFALIEEEDDQRFKKLMRIRRAAKNGRDCYKFGAKPSKFLADIYFSPEYYFRTLTAKNTESIDYAQARDNSESYNYGFGIGVRLSYLIKNQIALRAGLEYNQLGEVFKYEKDDDIRTIITEIKDSQTGEVLRDTQVFVGKHIKKTYNRFHLIDLPISLGYELQKNKWTIALNGGVSLNLLFRKRGDILSPQLEPVSISDSSEETYPAFASNAGISIFGSVGFYRHLNENWQVVVEPHYRHFLGSFSKSGYPLKQDYRSAGLLLGLRHRF